MKIGAHVKMSGSEMMLASAKEAYSYGANTFMIYTGAPQNTKRKQIDELNIDKAHEYMKEHDISDIVVHAPYIINLANTTAKEKIKFAIEFLQEEVRRTTSIGAKVLVLHPGSHVGAGDEAGTKQIIKGLNEVLTKETKISIALETMAGKGTEIGKNFEQLAKIFDGVNCSDKLKICFDTCHTHDSGYDIVNGFDGVMEKLDKLIGKEQIAVFHINDSKNVCGSNKDRHENIGLGNIGFDALNYIVHHEDFENIPKILETPYIKIDKKTTFAPYKYEIAMLKNKVFNDNLIEDITNAK